jgi:hypothetical protein
MVSGHFGRQTTSPARNPASRTKTIAADGSVSDDPSGPSDYSVISVDPIDAAVELATGCPVRQGGASIPKL